MPSAKQQLLEDLRFSGERSLAALRAVPEADLARGRYENGWDGRQILAHIAAIEWTYGRLIDLAKQPAPAAPGASSERAAEVRGGMDGYNARQVEKRVSAPVAELLAELAENRAKTIAAVEAADEALFETPVRSAGGRTGTLAQVFREVAIGHLEQHVRDITG